MDDTMSAAGVRLRRRQFLQAVAATASALGLSACSTTPTPYGGPAPSGGGAAANGAGSGGSNPIVIGVAISTTGSNGDTGTYQQQGYQLWEETVNSTGGLLGRPVKFLFYDDQSDPTTSSRLYEKLITQDKVDLVLGPYASNVSAAVAQVTERYHYAMIAVGAAATDIWQKGYKYVFGLASTTDLQYSTLIQDVIGPLKYSTVALIYEDSLFPISEINGAKEYLKKIEAKVVVDEKYPVKTTDVSSVLAHVRDASPDVVLGGTYTPDSQLIVRQSKELGVNPKLFAFTVGPGDPNFVANLGADANWITSPSIWEPVINTPGNAEFVQRYESRFNRPVDYHVATGYTGGMVLEAAVKQAASLDNDKIRDALGSLQMPTLLPGEYRVDSNGAQIGHTMMAIQIQNGKRLVVAPKSLATGTIQAPTPPWNER
jgi:branched-chain amino acid transport system substrate-binding protein